jgi:hypothetical protein
VVFLFVDAGSKKEEVKRRNKGKKRDVTRRKKPIEPILRPPNNHL